MDVPTPTALANAAGISVPYASQILNQDEANGRTPPLSLAVHIMHRTGWRHPSIAGLTDDQAEVIAAVQPWSPRAAKVAA